MEMKIATSLILVIILSTAKSSQSTSSKICSARCPKIFAPVCAAADGAVERISEGINSRTTQGVYRYFHNDCLRRYASCSTGTVWRLTTMSLCLQHVDPLVREQCFRPCPIIYEPVCATNGEQMEVFGNSCVLDVENCLSIEAWTLTDDSECGL
ncbi:U-Kazal-Dg21.2-like [Eurosta solidaginis]|uniref:U-Kazal-Dg21.2-like n=1 Tax=Eurosta solidaginis TaxID=178769 RepID=UPI00353139BF